GGAGLPLRRRKEHADLLLPALLPRPARARGALRLLPRRGGGAGGRLPAVQGLPAGRRLGRKRSDARREWRGATVVDTGKSSVVVDRLAAVIDRRLRFVVRCVPEDHAS